MTMRGWRMAALLTLGACSADPGTDPSRPPAPVEESALLPLRKPPPSAEKQMALDARNKPKGPGAVDPPGAIHLPAFTFRTMDRAEIKVELNGEPLSTTPCLWSITEAIAFDKSIELPKEDPKAGAKFVGSTELEGKPPSKVEVYVLTNPAQLGKYPSLRKDEFVVIVDGTIGVRPVLGALRVRVEGYRYTDYTPLGNPEGDDASRFLRTIWFERKTD
jgi:hypothetical protein